MSRRRGFISPARAARILGVHRNTVYQWAVCAERGEPSKLQRVERNPQNRYIYVSLVEVKSIKEPDSSV